MIRIVCLVQLFIATWTHPLYNLFEHQYPLAYPYLGYSGLNSENQYAPQSLPYSSYIPTYTDEFFQDQTATGYSTVPEVELNLNTLNILAELPYAMSNQFSVVPMYIISNNAMNMVSQGDIISISDQKPVITVKLNTNTSVPCTPAVRMVLEKPIIVGSLKSNVLFPSEVQIIHDGVRIPIRIGAVIAPVLINTYVSQETPIAIRVIYAVPTRPIKIKITIHQDNDDSQQLLLESQNHQQKPSESFLEQRFPEISGKPSHDEKVTQPQVISGPAHEQILQNPSTSSSAPVDNGFGALATNQDYVNNADAVFVPNKEAVVIESESKLPPKNITVIEFPLQEAEPHLEVDEENEELVNRNPPLVLAPAGIVQSTQPQSHVEAFHNDKESPYLETLRDKSKRKRI